MIQRPVSTTMRQSRCGALVVARCALLDRQCPWTFELRLLYSAQIIIPIRYLSCFCKPAVFAVIESSPRSLSSLSSSRYLRYFQGRLVPIISGAKEESINRPKSYLPLQRKVPGCQGRARPTSSSPHFATGTNNATATRGVPTPRRDAALDRPSLY